MIFRGEGEQFEDHDDGGGFDEKLFLDYFLPDHGSTCLRIFIAYSHWSEEDEGREGLSCVLSYSYV
jgi:hypothetical protein